MGSEGSELKRGGGFPAPAQTAFVPVEASASMTSSDSESCAAETGPQCSACALLRC